MLLGTLGTSILGNMLLGKSLLGTGEETNRAGWDF